MSGGAVVELRRLSRAEEIAEMLRGEWRLFDRVTLTSCAQGEGFNATMYLDETIVRGAAEQQGANSWPDLLSEVAARRAKAIAECVERVNSRLEPGEQIRHYQVIGG